MERLLLYASAVLISFLPARYRRRWNLEESAEMRGAAFVCGIVQAAGGAAVYMILFITRANDIIGRTGALVLAAQRGPSMDLMQVRLTTGVLGLANFALQPLHIVIGYFAVEGAVRAIAAMATGEPLPTLPLALLAALHNWIDEIRRERDLGPPIIDAIQPSDDATYDVRVLSCHPKPDWNPYISVRFRDEFYVLAGEERGPKPRPYVYRLRKNPTGRLVVVIREYQLDDPLHRHRK